MPTRQAARAGSFYEAGPDACRRHARRLIDAAAPPDDLTANLPGGIVPHAGWMFSGRPAALTLKALAQAKTRRTFILFGADHTGAARRGEVFDEGTWRTPLGDAPVDEELASAILAAGEHLRANPEAHGFEHSIEVQVPLIQVLAPKARIVPITVPPASEAVAIGEQVAGVLAGRDDVALVGSTDLTHHGGHFPSPGGRSERGVQWARENDQRMIRLIERMDAEAVIREADERGNACGAGAIAATVAACKQLGATHGRTLEYTNSHEVLRELQPGGADDTTVGYASVVFEAGGS